MKKGRKLKIPSESIEEKYIEFLHWNMLSKSKERSIKNSATKWAKEKGYSLLSKEEFCKVNRVGKNYPNTKEKQKGFWDKFHDHVITKEKPNFVIALSLLLSKNPESWYKIVYPEKAKQALVNKNITNPYLEDDPTFIEKFFGMDKE